jgi:hypothetical protein
MIHYLGKSNFKHKNLELSSKGRKSWERAKREGEGVPNSRCTTGEGIYLDVMLFLNEEREVLVADIKMASDLLQRLGFLINWEKSLPTPLSHWNSWE